MAYQESTGHQDEYATVTVGRLSIERRNLMLDLGKRKALGNVSMDAGIFKKSLPTVNFSMIPAIPAIDVDSKVNMD